MPVTIALPFTDGLTGGTITHVRNSPAHGAAASSNREGGACVTLVGISLCDGHRRDAGMKVLTAGNTMPGDEILHGGAYYLWALSTEQASCDLAGAYNFDVASIFK
jgi:hypothetical protein